MMQHPAVEQPLGRAGDLAARRQDVVSSGGLRLQAQGPQRLRHRLRELAKRQRLRVFHIREKRVVQIAQVVVHRAAAGHSPHHPDAVGLHESPVDLRFGVLVLADDHCVRILPQNQNSALPAALQHRLLKGQIIGRVRAAGLQIGGKCSVHLFSPLDHGKQAEAGAPASACLGNFPQKSVKSAALFSRKAAIPSSLSWVELVTAKASASSFRPLYRSISRPALMTLLAMLTA